MGRPVGKGPLGRWKDNVKLDLREMRWGGMD
jgi:hypothetical protein